MTAFFCKMKYTLVLGLLLAAGAGHAQQPYTRQDTLRGTLSPLRACYDVKHYALSVRVDPARQYISGANVISYRVVQAFDTLQIDLFPQLRINRIYTPDNKDLRFFREGNATFVVFPSRQKKNTAGALTVVYEGQPRTAVRPPWDGGFQWGKTPAGKDWVVVSCQHLGASSWWPCKDHLSDEPDSMQIQVAVPRGLMDVSNGVLRKVTPRPDGYTAYDWAISYPINTYNVTLNVADYAHLHDTYRAPDGDTLSLDYYILPENLQAAAAHFGQVKTMLGCYEKYLGKYPFWRDGYALVETPYWGMEHQGAVAYGNKYRNLPGFGFDFIIIHESGHEYFGNSISTGDNAELWVHESFTTYLEYLYLACTKGASVAQEYLNGQRKRIVNQKPLVGPAGVNYNHTDTDIYFKGSWMLHTLRSVVNNDVLWFSTLKKLAQHFKYQIVTTKNITDFLARNLKLNLTAFFGQYLYRAEPPTFEYEHRNGILRYRWAGVVPGFAMPLDVSTDGGRTTRRLRPGPEWQQIPLPATATIQPDTLRFYISLKKN